MEKRCLEDLKKDYKKIQEKYNLPSFQELNEDFQIEKIAEIETDLLIKEVRKFMSEKYSNYLRFIEAILNPVNVQMFIFSVIKSLGAEEKEKLTETYKILSKKELELIELDVEFSEEKEAEFIKESYKLWQDIKKDLLDVLEKIKDNWDNKSKINNKKYLG